MTDPQITGEDNTIRPDENDVDSTHGATEDKYVPVDGPMSDPNSSDGTDDLGIEPADEITPG
ncbi:hypothetical protein [Herpetosiphon llansteffanensis]|uniref:hypothetical protein n=1 Tax=Herpetosiphon llansteffanensis TaxID=2094568 RepID=UPI000D7C6D89|nr:hypothetical protein [Herpetosiphon llansteffanensis]